LELQDFCNQTCVMCPRNRNLHPSLPYELESKIVSNTDSLKSILQSAIKMGLKSVNFGAFSEPLIHKGLWELIQDCHKNGLVDSRVISNGLLLNKCSSQVFESGLRNLFISIDAHSPETYLNIRGRGYEKVLQNLHDFLIEKKRRNALLPIVRVSFVEMEINRHEKDAFIEYWSEKVDHVDIQLWSDYTRVPTAGNDFIKKPKLFECRSPWQRMSVLANGDILPCCDFNGRALTIGNIRNDSLASVWKSEKMESVRDNLVNDKSEICNNCQRGFGVKSII